MWIFLVKIIVFFAILLHCVCGLQAYSNEGAATQTTNKTTFTYSDGTMNEIPVETQSAQCTITAGDVRASAEATVSKKLEGVCATNHMSRAFSNLEQRFLNEINQLKAMLNLLLPLAYQNHFYAQAQPHLYQTLPAPPVSQESKLQPQSNLMPTDQIQNESPMAVSNSINESTPNENAINLPKNETTKADIIPNNGVTITSMRPTTERNDLSSERILEFRPVQKKLMSRPKIYSKKKTGPRDFEIHKFNNTILSGADLRIFTYYWKIEHFSQKLKTNVSFINSPIFSISGLHLRVKATLNHLNRDYLYLQLESVTNELVNENSNIILETGDTFKEIETKILFKHKIAILDQVTPTSDLISHEFLNTNLGFPVPNSAILSGPYSKDDNILIKIVIFL